MHVLIMLQVLIFNIKITDESKEQLQTPIIKITIYVTFQIHLSVKVTIFFRTKTNVTAGK